ncbi:glycosyl transferase family 1 [Deinococcus sp. HMF7620]|uniref:Glycosyl transferase family 1 n=1 Tax=Deinococcus arboris TaxID=2682977 RepID=A0A7C9HTG6_9DEIO|nr:glycosyl transferase family 1 [Deinococcus arboris]MVN88554.1 glycosyl transferase family 1 [Deinococcus arboris]
MSAPTARPAPPPLPELAAPSPFATFWLGGFECSTQRRPSGRRIDVIDATGHDRWAAQDYARLAAWGLGGARDGLRWHLIERRPGAFDFSSAEAQVAGAAAAGVPVIWDLLHYGLPDFVDVFSPEFPAQFARYVQATAAWLRARTHGELWLCPINEISFFAWGGGEVGYLNPFARGRGATLKAQLVRAAIAGMDAARRVDPGVRFLHAEPLIAVHAHPDRPHEAGAAGREHEGQFEALDLLLGRVHPELGGGPEYVDVIGLNYYPYNQWHHHPQPEARERVTPDQPAYQSLDLLLAAVHDRYGRPLLIAETGAEGDARAPWLEQVARGALAAQARGVPVLGVCLYPVVNHPGWDDDRHCPNGLWDYPDALGHRAADPALGAALARVQAQTPAEPLPPPAVTLAGFCRHLTQAAQSSAHEGEEDRTGAALHLLRATHALRAPLPLQIGGLGLDGRGALTVLRLLGRLHPEAAQLYESHLGALDLMNRLGTPQQREQAAQAVRAGDLFGLYLSEEAGESLMAPDRAVGGCPRGWPEEADLVDHLVAPVQGPGEGWALALWRPQLAGFASPEITLLEPLGGGLPPAAVGGQTLRRLALRLGVADRLFEAGRQALRLTGRQHDDRQRRRFVRAAAGLEGAWHLTRHASQLLDRSDEAATLAAVALVCEAVEAACEQTLQDLEPLGGGALTAQYLRGLPPLPNLNAARLALETTLLDAPAWPPPTWTALDEDRWPP